MRIAVTYENGQVYGHFGHTAQFKLYDAEDGEIVNSSIVDTNGSGHGALAGFLLSHKADVLICGGIGGGAVSALSSVGIRIYAGVTGSADEAVSSFLKGSLVYSAGANCSHSHDGEHKCGEHGCH